MGEAVERETIAGVAGLLLMGCATGSSTSAPPAVDTPERARAFIRQFANEHGIPPPPEPAPVTSLPEVADVLRADQLSRYPAARAFAEGASGVEALALRGLLELTWASSLRTVRDLLAEARVRLETEAEQLELRASPREEDQARLEALREKIGDFDRVREALDVVAEPHLQAGTKLADEAIRRYPTHPEPHFAQAMSFRLKRNWAGYGEEDRWLEAEGYETSGVRYMRALVELERGNRKQSAIEQLEALTADDPGLVRAQSELVLLYDDIEDVHRELEQLRSIAPDHLVVRLAGPQIDAEWEASRSMRTQTP